MIDIVKVARAFNRLVVAEPERLVTPLVNTDYAYPVSAEDYELLYPLMDAPYETKYTLGDHEYTVDGNTVNYIHVKYGDDHYVVIEEHDHVQHLKELIETILMMEACKSEHS